MLDQTFFDWWFAPWEYAAHSGEQMETGADRLALRDGYRWWCAERGISADLPQRFDPAWQIAVVGEAAELIAVARLFAGLLIARQQDAVMEGLTSAERKWCLSIAATQPLRSLRSLPYRADESMEVRGLIELSIRLDAAFAGMWDRLRLTLPQALMERVDELRQLPPPSGEEVIEKSQVRAQRCWRMCRERAGNMQ